MEKAYLPLLTVLAVLNLLTKEYLGAENSYRDVPRKRLPKQREIWRVKLQKTIKSYGLIKIFSYVKKKSTNLSKQITLWNSRYNRAIMFKIMLLPKSKSQGNEQGF